MTWIVLLLSIIGLLLVLVFFVLCKILDELRLLHGETVENPAILSAIFKKKHAARISDRSSRWLLLRTGKSGGD